MYLKTDIILSKKLLIRIFELSLLVLSFILLYIFHLSGNISNERIFFLFTFGILFIVVYESYHIFRLSFKLFLLNPALLSGTFLFINYGFANFFIIVPLESNFSYPDQLIINDSVVKLLFLVLLALVGMYLGYWIFTLKKTSYNFKFISSLDKGILASNYINKYTIILLLLIGLVVKILQIYLGIYGYSSTSENLILYGNYTKYISILNKVSALSLIISAYIYFKNKTIYNKILLIIVFLFELFFGIITGFKSAIVIPFVSLFLVYYIVSNKFNIRWLIIIVFAIFISYLIIEPYRVARNQNTSIDMSFGALFKTFSDADYKNNVSNEEAIPIVMQVIYRGSYTYVGSKGIEYWDDVNNSPSKKPFFLKNVILSPLYAFIPRFLLPSKPLGNMGLWYTNEVLGADNMSSTASGPVTYLYFVGSYLAVFVGFFLIGILQAKLWLLFDGGSSLYRVLFFLFLISSVTIIESTYEDIVYIWLREFPLIFLFILIFIKGRKINFKNSIGYE